MAKEEAQGQYGGITDTSSNGISGYVNYQSREIVNSNQKEYRQPEREVFH